MKKLLFLFAFTLGAFTINQTIASNYFVNESEVDQLIDNANEVEIIDLDLSSNNSIDDYKVNGKDPIIAIALDAIGLGALGIHRFYLGTEPIAGLLYPITCGGFGGIIPLIDFVVLILNYEDISPFVDNPNFFMWKDSF